MTRGRPKLVYEEWITDEKLEYITKCKRSNISDAKIYEKLGISKTKACEWKNEFKDFKEAFKKGQEELLIECENILFKRAEGYDVDDTEVTVEKNSEGKIVKTIVKKKKKHIWSDSNLQLILKRLSREKWGEKDKKEVDLNIKTSDVFGKLKESLMNES